MDGMDARLLITYMRKGLMPNCKRLMEMGRFTPLKSSDPAQSPVAWSNFISGTNPGGHGIFDFISRDASSLRPYLSTSQTHPPEHTLPIGKFSLPLSSARTELLRKGPTLWDELAKQGVPSTVFKAPVNFPPTPSDAKSLSGLTTPDIHGSYGIFSFYTNSPKRNAGNVAGGNISKIKIVDGIADCILNGPVNSFRKDKAPVNIPFKIETDTASDMARVLIQESRCLLKQGEWSDWVTVEFPMLAKRIKVSGICRFYLKQVSPHLELYVTPININPAAATMPVSAPDSYAKKLASELGPFYTQGMPEDTAALSAGVFSDDEFREQSTFVLKERMRAFEHEMNNFKDGFLYFYFSSLDLDSHAFWRAIDPEHPLYTKALANKHGDYIPWLYSQLDSAVGRAMEHLDDNTLLFVMSDHGFTSFRRQFNLNSWLMDNGYASPINSLDRGQANFFQNTDWSRTKAYGLGINSLYLNLRNREPNGIVNSGSDFESLRSELIQRLKAIRDPETGAAVISNVYRPQEIYSGPYTNRAPDLIVCYNEYYRASWDTILGTYPRQQLLDNLDPWSGDHCMDSKFVPGVLLCNRNWQLDSPALYDLAPTILSLYGLPIPTEMTGRNLFSL